MVAEPEYIDTQEALQAWVKRLREAPVVAVDTESDSMHHYRERVCLIQMTAHGVDVIIDPVRLDDVSALTDFFADPNITKVFHDAGYDLLCLRRDFNFAVAGIFDTMWASRLLGYTRFGLAALLEERFEFVADKRLRRSDWTHRPLSAEQIDYARFDTHFLERIQAQLWAELQEKGRDAWAIEDFQRMPQLAEEHLSRSKHVDPKDGFWRMRGIAGLTPVQLGRVRALHVMRDEWACKLDRPPYKVLSDAVLVALAVEAPATVDDLQPRPGLRSGGVKRFGLSIIRALDVAQPVTEKAPAHLRRKRRTVRFVDPAARKRYDELREMRKRVAAQLQLAPEVLLSNAVLEGVVRKALKTPDALRELNELQGWRGEFLLAPLLEVMAPAGQ